jgi:hypothetical protein
VWEAEMEDLSGQFVDLVGNHQAENYQIAIKVIDDFEFNLIQVLMSG